MEDDSAEERHAAILDTNLKLPATAAWGMV
jgi:hypothetical protein